MSGKRRPCPFFAAALLLLFVVVSGRLASAQTLFQDTSWEQRNVTTSASSHPGARYGAATVRVSSPKGLILFGGVDNDGVVLGDTWQYLTDQDMWLKLKSGSNSCCGKNCTTGSTVVPCPRAYSTLHSVSTRALLFGGSCALNPEISYTGIPCEDPLWEFDLLNNNWKRLYPEGGEKPVSRAGHAAVSQDRSLFVYGGQTSEEVEGEEKVVWRYNWDLNQWAKLEPQGELLKTGQILPRLSFTPVKRFGHAALVHQYGSKKRILFHGGMRIFKEDASDPGKLYVSNDILEWDITTSTWRKWDLQYSPFRAFHTMHLYSPSSAYSQGTGYMVMAFGFGHDKPNVRGTLSEVVMADVGNVRGVDIHVFDDNSVTSPDFQTYEVLQGLKPAARHAASGSFIADGEMLTIGGVGCNSQSTGTPDQSTCLTSASPYWVLHMKGQLYDQGSINVPAHTENGVEEILVMSGEMEIARWESGTALPVSLSIPSGTDIIVIGFKDGAVVATEKLMVVPEETKTLQLSYLQKESVVISCLREDGVSSFPELTIKMEVYDVKNKVWELVSQGKTDMKGQFHTELVPVRNLYSGILSGYVMKYETSYRLSASLVNGTKVFPSELIEVYPGIPFQGTYISEVESIPSRESVSLLPPKPAQNSSEALNSTTIVTDTRMTAYLNPLQYLYLNSKLYPLKIRQEFKLVVECPSAPIALFASIESRIKYPTAKNAEWYGQCTGSDFSGGPHTCSLTFNSFENATELLALGIITNLTKDTEYAATVKVEIIEKPEEKIEIIEEEPKPQGSSFVIDVEQIGLIVGCSVGFVLLVTSAIKMVHRRRKSQLVTPAKRGKMMPDVESGNGVPDGKGWQTLMSRNKDSDIFDDFGELASEYQRWMAQSDTATIKDDKESKLAALQNLSSKYDELQEDRKTLEGIPLATLNMNAKNLEMRKKYSGKGKPRKSENGLVVPRAPAGILPPMASYPKPPVDSPVGYDLTPKGQPADPRLSSKSSKAAPDPKASQIETDFLSNIGQDVPDRVKPSHRIELERIANNSSISSQVAAQAQEAEAEDHMEEDILSSPPPPPPPQAAPPSEPRPPPPPPDASSSAEYQLRDIQDVASRDFVNPKPIAIPRKPQNALQKMKKPRKKKK